MTLLVAATGLVLSAALCCGAIYGFVWLGNWRIAWASRQGIAVAPRPTVPSVHEVATRHGVDIPIFYALFFTAMGLAGFTISQRAGVAGLAALFYGSVWISRSVVDIELDFASAAQNKLSLGAYWCLCVADWLGYLGVLCFGTALVVGT